MKNKDNQKTVAAMHETMSKQQAKLDRLDNQVNQEMFAECIVEHLAPVQRPVETVLFQFSFLRLRVGSEAWEGSTFNVNNEFCPKVFLVNRHVPNLGDMLLVKIGRSIYTPYHNVVEFTVDPGFERKDG